MKNVSLLFYLFFISFLLACNPTKTNPASSSTLSSIDFQDCMVFSEPQNQSQCWWDQAKESLNHSYCERLTDDDEFFGNAKSLCQYDIAMLRNDLNICLEIQDSNKENCINYVSSNTDDPTKCDVISDSEQKQICLSNSEALLETLKACEFDDFKELCYQEFAVTARRLDLCKNINNSGAPWWEQDCISEIAVRSGNISLCSNVESKFTRAGCFGSLIHNREACERRVPPLDLEACYVGVGIESDDEELCRLVKDEELSDHCFFSIAYHRRNSSLCQEIIDLSYKESCIANNPSGISECNQITNQSYKDVCYFWVASQEQNLAFCDLIVGVGDYTTDYCYSFVEISNVSVCYSLQSQQQKDFCFSSVSKLQNSPSYCGHIQNESIRDGCYFELSWAYGDKRNCENISNSLFKEQCQTRIVSSDGR